ncbi:hypothetical protein J4479_03800 [Candidatus Woesearchaeota archaeon]|nr:hypothetical protein [Candidatus Woesearchaeota archaeon]
MRLTTKKVEEILVNLLSEEGLPLIRELAGKFNISEFDLASKTKKDIKIIRKMLYLLYNHNLVGFTRKKDKQKGWYIYYWTLLPESIKFNYFKTKRDLLERLKQQLAQEEKELFFICPNDCIRLDFDQSIGFEFHCPECGELITQDDSQKKIFDLKNKISEIEEELEEYKQQQMVRRTAVKEHKKQPRARKKQAQRMVSKEKKTIKKRPLNKRGKKKKIAK